MAFQGRFLQSRHAAMAPAPKKYQPKSCSGNAPCHFIAFFFSQMHEHIGGLSRNLSVLIGVLMIRELLSVHHYVSYADKSRNRIFKVVEMDPLMPHSVAKMEKDHR